MRVIYVDQQDVLDILAYHIGLDAHYCCSGSSVHVMRFCRDVELAKFEAFLKKQEAMEISALVRGSQHLAYPIKGYVI